jgi:cell division protein FtsB
MNYQEHNQILDSSISEESFSERRFGLSTGKFFLVVGLIVAILFYLSVLIFGNNSLLVLINLEEYQTFLTEDIERLKSENASLQKQYFELKELDADSGSTQEGEHP